MCERAFVRMCDCAGARVNASAYDCAGVSEEGIRVSMSAYECVQACVRAHVCSRLFAFFY